MPNPSPMRQYSRSCLLRGYGILHYLTPASYTFPSLRPQVETPVLESIAGGADARPVVTYHNTLRRNFTLRIATELHLKVLPSSYVSSL